MRGELGPDALIVDVGAGSVNVSGVVTIDIAPGSDVRGDMRALPLADASVDGLLYAASIHYAPVEVAIAEAGRVLKPRGVLVAIDSPMYRDAAAAAAARSRTAAYYASAGFPELAAHYHPVEVGRLRSAFAAHGLEIARLTTGSRWRRLLRRGPTSFVLARKLR